MGLYMLMANYSSDATKKILETGSNREEAARAAIEAVGGKLLGFYGMFGQDYQVVIICEAPGPAEYIAGIAPAITAGVLEEWRTIPLYTAADMVKASDMVKQTGGAYRPPGD